ncbi:hypothetical protein [Acinetobacter sp. ANC 3832]
MDILKFIRSFNTLNSYLTLAFLLLIFLTVYIYILNPA